MKTDNGPPFRSTEFAQFCDEKGVKHQKITPRWPEVNGLVERFMRCIGKVARIASSEGKDFIREIDCLLADYRVTHDGFNGSDGEDQASFHCQSISNSERRKDGDPPPECPSETEELFCAARQSTTSGSEIWCWYGKTNAQGGPAVQPRSALCGECPRHYDHCKKKPFCD